MEMQPVGGKIMKNKAMMKKFRMRIGIVLFMVLIMLVGSCLSELRFSALAMDTAGEALAEMGQGEASGSSKSMPQPEPVAIPEQQDKTRVESETAEPETAPEGAEGEEPAAVDGGEEANAEESTSGTETAELETAPEESNNNNEVNNLEMDAAASAMAAALESAVSTPAPVETPLLALAAPQAGETPDEGVPPVDEGETEMEEDYAVNAGSATLTINGVRIEGSVYTNDTANNAIRNALLGAVDHLKTNLPEAPGGIVDIIVTVGAGTYEGGVDLGAGDKDSLRTKLLETLGLTGGGKDPIANISIVAEDAMETDNSGNATPTADTDGKAIIEGNLIFDGFNTLLAGIYIGMNSKVSAANADRFAYYGTREDDDVDIDIDSVGGVTVDTGDGDDTVDLTVKQEPTVQVGVDPQAIEDIIITEVIEHVTAGGSGGTQSVTTQEGFEQLVNDTVTQIKENSVSGSGERKRAKVTVHTGAGDDVANVEIVNALAFSAGEQAASDPNANPDIAYSFELDLGGTDVDIDLGDGADEVNVSGGMSMLYGRKAIEAVIDFAKEQLDTVVEGSHIVISGGAGDDTIAVDTTAAYYDLLGADVRIDAGADFDRMHLTGELAEMADVEDRIAGSLTQLHLETQAEIQVFDDILGHFTDENPVTAALALRQPLEIAMSGVEAVTDLLDNKASVELTGAETHLSVEPFTDYILSANPDVEVAFSVTVAGDGFLSNLLVTAAESAGENRLAIETLKADGLNVFVIAPQIEVSGEVSGENVIFVAESLNSEALDASVTIVEDELTGEALEFGFDFIEAKETASISVGEGASILAGGFVDLRARTLQTGGYIDPSIYESIDIPHFVVVKLGSANIDILGDITAQKGFVNALASARNEFDTGDLLSLIPLSFGMGDVEAKVTLGGEARISAGAGARLMSDTFVYVDTYDDASFPKFNVSLAGNVVTADTKTIVSGNASIVSGGDTRVDARSRAASYAVSMAVPTDVVMPTARSGIFLGANFAFAETMAQVLDAASLESRTGNASVEADGILHTRTYAISSPVSVYAVDEDGNPVMDANGQPVKATQTATVLSLVSTVEEILGHVPKEVNSVKAKLIGGITGSNSLALKFNSGTEPPKDAVTQASTQFVGALSIAAIDNEVSALINTTGSVRAAQRLSLRADGDTTSRQRADGSLYENASLVTLPGVGQVTRTLDPSNNAAGVGVAVGVFSHDVSAIAQKGTVVAGGGLDVSANSRRVESSVVSKAGHIPATSSFGLGGAVAVHIASVRNEARLANAARYALEGAVNVESVIAHGLFETVGDASGKRVRKALPLGPIDIPLIDTPTYRADSVGVGAGIAVGVIGVDVSAVIEDGVNFNNKNQLDSLRVAASFAGTEELRAAAGASGGISATPVAATDISGIMVEAYLGKGVAASSVR